MNTYPTFQSNLPSHKDLVAIRRRARALQAEYIKSIFATVTAALFGRGDDDGMRAATPQHS